MGTRLRNLMILDAIIFFFIGENLTTLDILFYKFLEKTNLSITAKYMHIRYRIKALIYIRRKCYKHMSINTKKTLLCF